MLSMLRLNTESSSPHAHEHRDRSIHTAFFPTRSSFYQVIIYQEFRKKLFIVPPSPKKVLRKKLFLF